MVVGSDPLMLLLSGNADRLSQPRLPAIEARDRKHRLISIVSDWSMDYVNDVSQILSDERRNEVGDTEVHACTDAC
jgi:hypothetical protein